MFTIDLILKYTPMPLSVQRQDQEGAESLYREISEAMNSGNPKVLEVVCDGKIEKRLKIATSELVAVQMSQKGPAGGDRQPGFFVATADS
ncbi:MAG: hypothetical protein R6U67_13630 [Sodalinema sp.]|uniref:hypothetical protein n=1 Tax=Sodalinema sp. TaxID=3080550 RepID=UPI0012137158|nr:MAG: hypothetical protein EYR95_17870 [Phormidium sp. SL48-SHIP]